MQVLLVVWMLVMGVKDVAAERGVEALKVLAIGTGDRIAAEGPFGPPPPRP